MTTPFAIGVDVGGTKLEAIALDPAGGERWRQRVPTPQGDYDGTVRAVRDLVHAARRAIVDAPCTVGIGTPGSQTAAGTMKNANSTCLNGRPFAADLATAIGQPVRLANDANCLALSEATDGAGAGATVVFAVILGTGCGGGVAVHGRVLTGPNSLAGEWGHMPLPWRTDDDPELPCYCGRAGCIETLLSGIGLARDHAAIHGGALTGAEIAAAAAAGDRDCIATLRRHHERFARALAVVSNLLDPDVVVVGGGLSQVASLYSEVPMAWARYVFAAGSTEAPRLRLQRSLHGDSSGVRGAAWLWR